MVEWTTRLNTPGEALAEMQAVHGLTDVTGFGLAGHLLEILRGSRLSGEVRFDALPVIPEALEWAKQGIATGASERNWKGYGHEVQLPAGFPDWKKKLLTDPQTSGGLLVATSSEAQYSCAGLLTLLDHGSEVLLHLRHRQAAQAVVRAELEDQDRRAVALQRRLDARQAPAGRLPGDARVDDAIIWALALEALAKQRHPAARLADAVSRRQAVPVDQNRSPSGLGAACENHEQQERSDGEGHRQGGEERRERSRHSAGHRPGNHARRGGGGDRRLRVGQVDAARDSRRPRHAEPRPGRDRRRRSLRAGRGRAREAARNAGRLRVPVVPAPARLHGPRERDVAAGAGRPPGSRKAFQ